MEDDIDLDIVRCWNFTWSNFIAKMPYDWDVIQLSHHMHWWTSCYIT